MSIRYWLVHLNRRKWRGDGGLSISISLHNLAETESCWSGRQIEREIGIDVLDLNQPFNTEELLLDSPST